MALNLGKESGQLKLAARSLPVDHTKHAWIYFTSRDTGMTVKLCPQGNYRI